MSKIRKIYEPDEYNNLNLKQKAWIDYYIKNRNKYEASRLAGYKGNSMTLRRTGVENYVKFEKIIEPRLAEIDKQAEDKRINELVDIFEMWSTTMNNQNENMSNRLKASELLAKAKGAFVERGMMDVYFNPATFQELTTEELRKIAKCK